MAQLKNHERSFFFFEVEVITGKKGAPKPSMDALLEIWSKYQAAGTATMALKDEAAHLVMGDIAHHAADNFSTMLIRISDSQAPNAVYSNVKTGAWVEHLKAEADGNDVGAHVLISRVQEKNKPNVYFALVEAVPGVSHREVQRLLNKVLRYQHRDDISAFTYPDPNGKKKRDGTDLTHDHQPLVKFSGRPSATFVADITSGKISGISLLKSEQNAPVAGVPYLKKDFSELRLGIDRGNAAANMWDDIKAAMKSEAAEYPTGKIVFKLPDQLRGVTVIIDSDTGTPINNMYIQSVLISGIVPLLSSSSQTIVPHLETLAKAHLLGNRDV